jgi:UDP-3-O-[3-hydroxymyristoyl] glucosamine N-acyltransferase
LVDTHLDVAGGPMSKQLGQSPVLSLDSIAELVGGRVVGDAAKQVRGVSPVDEATDAQIAFLAARRYLKFAEESKAAAFLISEELEAGLPDGASAVVVADPYPALRTLLHHLFPKEERTAAIHPTVILGSGVTLGEGVDVGPYAVLEDRVELGAGARIGAHCVIGRSVTIGPGTVLHPHVVVYDNSVIGRDVEVHSGACLGSDGFGYTYIEGEHRKMPQVGRCVIEDGVEIGANTAIDRGSLGDTVIGRGSKVDNLVQIAHNVRIGAGSLLAALVGVAGSTRVGKNVWVGGQAGIINQLDIGDGARIAVASKVFGSVPEGETVSGHPARPHRDNLLWMANAGKVPKLMERVSWLEDEVKRISGE